MIPELSSDFAGIVMNCCSNIWYNAPDTEYIHLRSPASVCDGKDGKGAIASCGKEQKLQ